VHRKIQRLKKYPKEKLKAKRKTKSQFQKNSKNKNSQHPIKANQMKNK
jgi:hypothetical protein